MQPDGLVETRMYLVFFSKNSYKNSMLEIWRQVAMEGRVDNDRFKMG